MTVLNPYYLSADGHVIATYADSVEIIRGLKTLPAKRRQVVYAANRHGSLTAPHLYRAENHLQIQITLLPVDADNATNHPYLGVGHLQENLEALFAIFDKSTPIDLRQKIPTRTAGIVEMQASALVDSVVTIEGNAGVWRMLVDLVLQYPWWHELPLITRASASSHSFTTGGTAPIADMVLTFAGNGTLTYAAGGSILQIADATGAVVVDVGNRLVTQGGLPARQLLRLGVGTPAHWLELPAKTAISLTSTVGVAVAYYNARAA